MMPGANVPKRSLEALYGLLKGSGQRGGCRLGTRGGELELKVTIVGSTDRDHFQR